MFEGGKYTGEKNEQSEEGGECIFKIIFSGQ